MVAPFGDFGVVGGDHRGSPSGGHTEYAGQCDGAGCGVEFGGGFVGDEQPGLQGQGAGDGDALLLAAGQFFDDLPGVGTKAELFQRAAGRRLGGRGGHAGGAERYLDVLSRGQQGDEAVTLQDEGYASGGPGVSGEPDAVEVYVAAGGGGEPGDDGQQAGFP